MDECFHVLEMSMYIVCVMDYWKCEGKIYIIHSAETYGGDLIQRLQSVSKDLFAKNTVCVFFLQTIYLFGVSAVLKKTCNVCKKKKRQVELKVKD